MVMRSSYDELFEAVLALPAGSRAMLAEHLLESLDDAGQNAETPFGQKRRNGAPKRSKQDASLRCRATK